MNEYVLGARRLAAMTDTGRAAGKLWFRGLALYVYLGIVYHDWLLTGTCWEMWWGVMHVLGMKSRSPEVQTNPA